MTAVDYFSSWLFWSWFHKFSFGGASSQMCLVFRQKHCPFFPFSPFLARIQDGCTMVDPVSLFFSCCFYFSNGISWIYADIMEQSLRTYILNQVTVEYLFFCWDSSLTDLCLTTQHSVSQLFLPWFLQIWQNCCRRMKEQNLVSVLSPLSFKNHAFEQPSWCTT